jgi:hypothetical protein
MNKLIRILSVILLAMLVMASFVAAAHADGGVVIDVEPDGAVVVAPAAESTQDEDDPPIPPDAAGEDFYVYVSSPGSGTVAGIAYDDEDIMVQNTATGQWTKAFDGTNHGLPASADIDALDYSNANLYSLFYMSFLAPTAVPGLGTVDDSDVVLRSCYLLGSCSWSLFFDGSAYGLTTDAEDIDAIDVSGGNLWLSTFGGYSVPKYGGGTLKGGDEDIIVYSSSISAYILRLDGSAKGLTAGNDLKAFDLDRHFSPDRDWIFMTFEDPFTYQQTTGNAASGAPNDIFVDEMPTGGSGGAPRAGTILDASAEGFSKFDAIELVEN